MNKNKIHKKTCWNECINQPHIKLPTPKKDKQPYQTWIDRGFIEGVSGKTINYAYKLRQLGADSFHFSIATPIYGAELYEIAKRGGFLRDDFSDEALSSAEPLIETPEFTADDLRKLCIQANLVNQTLTRDKLIRAVRYPKKTIEILIRKMKTSWIEENNIIYIRMRAYIYVALAIYYSEIYVSVLCYGLTLI